MWSGAVPMAVRRALVWRAIGAVAVALVCVGCGELTVPEAYAPPTSSTIAAGVEQETASQVEERPGIGAGTEELVPTQAGYIPTLLVSSSEFVIAADEVEDIETETVNLTSVPLTGAFADLVTVRAVDDLSGGLVVQEPAGAITYVQPQGGPELLANPGDTLLDVGFWGGSPRAFVQTPTGAIEWIQLASEQPGAGRQREFHFELAEGEELVAFSASRDLQAAIIQDDQCGELRFYGEDGQVLALQGPTAPECVFPGRPSFGTVALSPDGGAVAYTVVTYRGDGTEAATELLAWELISGTDAFVSRRIGEDLDAVTSLTFDGRRVAYVKAADDVATVTLLDLSSQSEQMVDTLGVTEVSSVSFARIPVAPVG